MVKEKGTAIINLDFQDRLEEAVLLYQNAVKNNAKVDIDYTYKKIIKLYNPLDFYSNWYEQYKYLFDTQDDFIGDYLKVFSTVLLGWKPRNQRKKSRYDGSGEFKNYFIGSLYHNYINMVKADQAAKRNITKPCPLCDEWVNPLSTHLITNHQNLLWDYLNEMNITIDNLSACPFCSNFKISKNVTDKQKIKQIIENHFLSKHTSLLFHRFNEIYPGVSTISPRIVSTNIDEDNDELDIYDITQDTSGLISKLYALNLDETQKKIIELILNGDSNITYKPDKYKCTKDEWDMAIENLKEAIGICGYE